MDRNLIILVIHPYKNHLLKKKELNARLKGFGEKLMSLSNDHPNLRFHLVLPGYMLEGFNAIQLSKLNKMKEKGILSWITTGYTEPFITFSPQWLTGQNLGYNAEVFKKLTGAQPRIYMPPFSNWEPSSIGVMKQNGMQCAVFSNELLPEEASAYCGYWIAEHAGNPIPFFPLHTYHQYNAPVDVSGKIENLLGKCRSGVRIITIEYLVPLVSEGKADSFKWLYDFSSALDELLINSKMIHIDEASSYTDSLGLMNIPPGIVSCTETDGGRSLPSNYFSNYLHSFDSVAILQRKLLNFKGDSMKNIPEKKAARLLKELFFAQDINRYLPGHNWGIHEIKERMTAFSRMIEVENKLQDKQKVKKGQIAVADFLKNDTKSITLSNNLMKAYINHKRGGQIYELDLYGSRLNILASHNPERHSPPGPMVSKYSGISFADHFIQSGVDRESFLNTSFAKRDKVFNESFEYNIKNTSSSTTVLLNRQGAISIDDKQYSINIEKAFSLENNKSNLTFAYKLSNYLLVPFSFTFATEFNFALAGALPSEGLIEIDHVKYPNICWERYTFKNKTKFLIHDRFTGVKIRFNTRKPVDIWCVPSSTDHSAKSKYQGTRIILVSTLTLKENSSWSMQGKLSFSTSGRKDFFSDAI